ncbi:hypothetical protein [Rhizobium sp. BK176]|uniref:hypothetical protein n=1 Tax=Rhizobium sp. BK176 TaxID=2587071 RepID=UPI002169FE42|nr:hypothetical protein [Rhizobium sp. BK176]MCS4089791.1 hypothetical protein [Rhizobium sp. BK176]
MTQRFEIADKSGRQYTVDYEAYRWRDLTRFLVDHANGEELMLLEFADGDPDEARIFGWSAQSAHDQLVEMHWQSVEAAFPEKFKLAVAVNLPIERERPSERLAQILETEANPAPFVRSGPR